jgi:hypothetical protein
MERSAIRAEIPAIWGDLTVNRTISSGHGSNDWRFAAEQHKAQPTTRTGLLDPT